MELKQRLQAFFAQPGIRKWAPVSLLAATTGIIIGTITANPALPQTGAGLVLSGLAINLASGLLQPIFDAVDDETRAELLEKQLGDKETKPETTRLTAAALLEAAPILAEVLPVTSSAALITNLEKSMVDAGGALAKIAPSYISALRAPPVDWGTFRSELAQIVATSLIDLEVENQAIVERLHIHHENQPGNATIRVKGGDGVRISDVGITQIGGKAVSRTCPDCGTPVMTSAARCSTCGLALTAPTANPTLVIPMTILAVFANPPGSGTTHWEDESKALRAALAPHPDRFRIELLHDCTVDELHQALLRHRPAVLHIQSHGTRSGIQVQTSHNDPHTIGWRALMQTLGNVSSLRCVVLNACESGVHQDIGPTHFDLITTPGLISTEVTRFYTSAFYDTLAARRSIAECHSAGCNRVDLYGITAEHRPEWRAAQAS